MCPSLYSSVLAKFNNYEMLVVEIDPKEQNKSFFSIRYLLIPTNISIFRNKKQ